MCKDKIKDSPQSIRIDLPLGFVYTGLFTTELWWHWQQCQMHKRHLDRAVSRPLKDIANHHG